jgi:trans-aconitate methyltransferase
VTALAKSDEFTSDRALSFWPTPADTADDLVYWLLEPWHGNGEGVRVLEPSAGEGHLIHAIRRHLPHAHVTAVEPSPARAATLRRLPNIDVVEATLEDYLFDVAMQALAGQWEPFHLAVMNPPFTLDSRPEAWADHVAAIYHDPHLLTPGGVIGAIVPRVVMTGNSKRVRAVRELLTACGGVEECDRAAFASVGAKVSTALMWAQKPVGGATS